MGWRIALVVIAFAACGRIGFDRLPSGDGDGGTQLPGSGAVTSDAKPGAGSGVACTGGSCACTNSCTRGCSGSGCMMSCSQGANCDFSCDGGGCTFDCEDTTCCEFTCNGGGCKYIGASSTTIIGSCSQDCMGMCTEASDCLVSCGSAKCPCMGPGCD